MKRENYIFPILGVLLLVLLAADVALGSVFIPLSKLWEGDGVQMQILMNLRLPKAITAILAGMALSVSGLMMQTLFRNPLAGPYILGVSSGATLGVALATMALSFCSVSISPIPAAVIGATAVLLLVVVVSRKVTNNVSLLITGMMFGSIAGALVNLIQNYSNPDALKLFIVWTLGSLSAVGWKELMILAPVVVLVLAVVILFIVKPLNGLMLGENYARGIGIDVPKARLAIVLATGLLAGSVTAYCGPIAFVGVAVPHIARGVFKTSNHRITIPASMLVGADILLLCDLLCSLSTYPLPISTMSALFGAPIIIWIILRGSL